MLYFNLRCRQGQLYVDKGVLSGLEEDCWREEGGRGSVAMATVTSQPPPPPSTAGS